MNIKPKSVPLEFQEGDGILHLSLMLFQKKNPQGLRFALGFFESMLQTRKKWPAVFVESHPQSVSVSLCRSRPV